ncbi:hypothetical protein SUNI508_02921 [Seiridium unicorne]|uniref:Uncharacterized protein n=1 Tax=Seiridium unicorne TaxID=138068 RepID=A0ABR2VF65_9PEZI
MPQNQKPSGMEAVDILPAKRKRVDSTKPDAHVSLPAPRPPAKKARLASDLGVSSPDDSKILELVQAKYDVQIHSVISSSKIQKKVSSVLRHVTSATPESSSESGKQPVSILRARASDAGKLVSIGEIAKREIATRPNGDGKRHWFQYIGLGQEIKEVPKEKNIIEETVLAGKHNVNDDEGGDEHENENERDDFEYMKTPFERAIEGKPKKQAITTMSLFLARVPVDELKRRYGEQTNLHTAKAKT